MYFHNQRLFRRRLICRACPYRLPYELAAFGVSDFPLVFLISHLF